MPAIASIPQANEEFDKTRSSRCRKMAIALVLGNALVVGSVSAGACSGIDYDNSTKTAMQTGQDSTDTEPQRVQINAEAMRATVVGTASMYNPYRDEYLSGGKQTASGEPYDPNAWTAAIQIDLRDLFGGVRYGKNYRPAYALVESADKRAIVKINDVGPLKPGRVINLDQQSMRYFDPSLQAGLIHDVKITLLVGEDWTPGPIGSEQPISVAAEQLPDNDRTPEPIDGQQLANVFAEQLPGEDRTPEPIASEQPISVDAAPYRIWFRSRKMDVKVTQFILISTIGILLALLATAPKKVGGAEGHAAKPRPRSRRKSRRKGPRKAPRKSRRKTQ
jgi:peptidoglycan lytic transglycosylase